MITFWIRRIKKRKTGIQWIATTYTHYPTQFHGRKKGCRNLSGEQVYYTPVSGGMGGGKSPQYKKEKKKMWNIRPEVILLGWSKEKAQRRRSRMPDSVADGRQQQRLSWLSLSLSFILQQNKTHPPGKEKRKKITSIAHIAIMTGRNCCVVVVH